MAYTTAIFDMDGTILDTLDDLWVSVNYALARHAMPKRDRQWVRSCLGNGMEVLIRNCVPTGTSTELSAKVLADFKEHYAIHCNDRTRPYPGISTVLNTLHDHHLHCAVVSNKGDFAVQELIERHFRGQFDSAVGERPGIRRKPAPDVVFTVMEHFDVGSHECVYIGDSEVDIETARNAGCDCIAVDWGFRDLNDLKAHGATHIVHTPDELLAAIIGTGEWEKPPTAF